MSKSDFLIIFLAAFTFGLLVGAALVNYWNGKEIDLLQERTSDLTQVAIELEEELQRIPFGI